MRSKAQVRSAVHIVARDVRASAQTLRQDWDNRSYVETEMRELRRYADRLERLLAEHPGYIH